MRLLVLIIASDETDIYKAEQNLWRTYMKKQSDIDCYFMKSSAILPDVRVFDDTIYIPGREGLDTIKHKTIESVRYFLKDERYTHVLRTNLSSFYVWERLLSTLRSLPRERLYAGVVGEYYGNRYASGAGYVMSRDVAEVLVATSFPDYTRIDDVDVGIFLTWAGYIITPLTRCDDLLNPDVSYYHYRLKRTNRLEELNTMEQMIQTYYS